VVISSQHAEASSNEELHADILKYVIQAVLPPSGWTSTPSITSPDREIVIGGPMGDTGSPAARSS